MLERPPVRPVLIALLAVLVPLLPACSSGEPEPAAGPGAPTDAPRAGGPRAGAPVATRPDVLLLVLDSFRVDRMGTLGGLSDDRGLTPNLDGLSRAGATSLFGYSPSPHTAPSLASILTGVDPAVHGVRNVDADGVWVLNDRVPTILELARAAGWRTVLANEAGQVRPESGFDRGVDVMLTTLDLEASISSLDAMLGAAPEGQPLFVVLHTYACHPPFLPPRERYGETFRGRFTDPEGGGEFRRRQEALEGFEGNRRGREYADLAQGFLEPYEGMSAEELAWLNDLYDENLVWVDSLVGDLLAVWSNHRSLGDAVLVVTAGHGIALGEGGRLGNARGLDGAVTRVPLILSGPGVAPGLLTASLSPTSVAPTLLELMGLDVPEAMRPPLGEVLEKRGLREVLGQFQQHSLATQEYGYSRMRYTVLLDASGEEPVYRAYDVLADPLLATPAELEPDVMDLMRTELDERLAKSLERQERFPPRRAPLDPRGRQRLRVLGYAFGR